MDNNSRLVYSTGVGRVKKTADGANSSSAAIQNTDGIVRIRRESKGRGGKVVSVVDGIPSAQQKEIGKLLKASCATGGSIKENLIEIQGEHREKIKTLLEKRGYSVKVAGG